MKRGEKVSKETLVKDGWKMLTTFGNNEVWGKDLDRILWNPKSEIITLSYTRK